MNIANKVIVAGGRLFSDYELLSNELDKLRKSVTIGAIVSGKARGADSLGEKYAREHGIMVLEFPANWEKFGKSAGYKRNVQMANNADILVAFWDGKSKGTGHMIDIANDKGLDVHVIKYKG